MQILPPASGSPGRPAPQQVRRRNRPPGRVQGRLRSGQAAGPSTGGGPVAAAPPRRCGQAPNPHPGRRRAAGVVIAAAVAVASGSSALAQHLPLVRDAEIEFHLRAWSDPVFAAAGLDADSVEMYLVNAPTVNAFVAGGQKIFIHTGLIVRAGAPDALIGVVAHETGHIAAGHLVRHREAAERASIVGLATSLIAVGVGALGGGDDTLSLGAAGMSLGGNVAERLYLQHSRSAEHAADLAALQYLQAVGRSARPLAELLLQLQAREQTLENLDPYTRTHPLTQDRIQQILDWTRDEPVPESVTRSADRAIYRRLVAKIVAFTDPPEATLRRYSGDHSVAGRYAHAIAFYRKSDLSAALAWIDGLLADHADDPYFHELRGQMLLENGRVAEASESYWRAAELAPKAPTILVGFAQAELETGNPSSLAEVTAVLERVLELEPVNAKAWRLLAVAHGRAGNEGLALLATAERTLVGGRPEDAQRFAARALEKLPPGSPAFQRAEDIGLLLQ